MRPGDRPYFTLTAGNNDPDMVGGAGSRKVLQLMRLDHNWPYPKLTDSQALKIAGYPDFRIAGAGWFRRKQIANAVPPPVAKATFTELWEGDNMAQHAVLDLFAGSGVGVACQQLGVPEYGVEKMPAAQETRRLNGMTTVYDDVWDIEKAEGLEFDTLWASPPCQSFSVAGKGSGRKALDDVLRAIDSGRWTSMDSLRTLGDEVGDERTALVLTPLTYVHRYMPTYIAFEQVTAVLPVWEACAEKMREWGYSVWTGYIHAEQYGVPQTRKRAYLIARSDGKQAKPPAPTHSKYYSRDPKRMDEGVLPWVSMADALEDFYA